MIEIGGTPAGVYEDMLLLVGRGRRVGQGDRVDGRALVGEEHGLQRRGGRVRRGDGQQVVANVFVVRRDGYGRRGDGKHGVLQFADGVNSLRSPFSAITLKPRSPEPTQRILSNPAPSLNCDASNTWPAVRLLPWPIWMVT